MLRVRDLANMDTFIQCYNHLRYRKNLRNCFMQGKHTTVVAYIYLTCISEVRMAVH